MDKKLTIAIDGFSGCGKSTLAKDLAKKLDYIFIDTGAMYRGITLFAMQNELIVDGVIDQQELIRLLPEVSITFKKDETTNFPHLHLNGVDVEAIIRTPEVAAVVSRVAAIKEVRIKMVAEQRIMGAAGGVILDGRDIASVVFPNADLKLFVTADPLVRAQRRLNELAQNGIASTVEDVLANLLERDEIDRNREEGPLIKVDDAIEIDTTDLTRESQLALVLDLINNL